MIGAVGISAGLWAMSRTPPFAPRPVMRFPLTLPPNEQLGGLDSPVVALSPTGEHLAYVGTRGSTSRLLLHPMDILKDEPMPGTERAFGPFFSPDGQWVGFFADGKLKKASIGGDAPVDVCVAPIGFGAVWGPDNVITFAPTGGSGLMQVAGTGGTPREITTLNAGEFSHRWPDLLPDGETLLFAAGGSGSWDDAQIVMQSLKSGARQPLIAGTFPHYVPTGHLLFARRGALWAVRLDVANRRVVGPPIMVLPKVWASVDGAAQFSLSPLGDIVYVEGGPSGGERTLVWVNRSTKAVEPLAARTDNYSEPRLSPAGTRLAVAITQASDNIWTYDISTSQFTQLTFDGNNSMPVWTSETRLAFASTRAGALNLFWRPADGTGTDERLAPSAEPQAPHAWSAATQRLFYVESSPTTGRDIWMVSTDGNRQPVALLQSPFNETGPTASPDGRWLAYVSDESGHDEVYVVPLMSGPGARAPRQISTNGGTEPLWSRSGDEIFYRTGDSMMATGIRTAPAFQAGPLQLLFEGAYQKGRASRPAYDSADGRRFLMVRTDDRSASPTQFQVVLEWFAELKRRVPDQ
jgi:serine/threonine-protein kinase